MKPFGIIFWLLILAVGCAEKQLDTRFYCGVVTSNDLVGTWIIEERSIPELRTLGYAVFTNKSDHVLLLNTDSTCAYRGFDDYAIPALWFNRTEFAQHDGFLREGSAMWPHGVPDAKSWYIWVPSTSEIIGPYEQTNILTIAGGILVKNRWTRWALQDGSDGGSMHEDEFGVKYKFRIRLSHPTFKAETLFILGKDDRGFFLWKPVSDRLGGTVLTDKMICFRRAYGAKYRSH